MGHEIDYPGLSGLAHYNTLSLLKKKKKKKKKKRTFLSCFQRKRTEQMAMSEGLDPVLLALKMKRGTHKPKKASSKKGKVSSHSPLQPTEKKAALLTPWC